MTIVSRDRGHVRTVTRVEALRHVTSGFKLDDGGGDAAEAGARARVMREGAGGRPEGGLEDGDGVMLRLDPIHSVDLAG